MPWDEALEYGIQGTRLMQGVYRALATEPMFGDKACTHCRNTFSIANNIVLGRSHHLHEIPIYKYMYHCIYMYKRRTIIE